jgi:hypothetical protein
VSKSGGSARNPHLVTVPEAHAPIEAPACLGKKRHETEAEASAMRGTSYHCPWCLGWHVTRHGRKGMGRIGHRR